VRAGDRLRRLNGRPVASYADIRFALDPAPAKGSVPIAWQRGGQRMQAEMTLAPGWRHTDISWRASMWGLSPTPSVHGDDLSASEKRAIGLPADHLAFRQGKFVTAQAREAGIREGDLIVAFNGGSPAPTVTALNLYVRLHHKVGDRVTFTVLRDGQKVDLTMTLAAKATW
jgi:S1-C subfamily serine protease